MSTATKTKDIGPGEHVSFVNEGELHVGIVNGEPWVMWDGEKVSVLIPVHERARDWNGLIAAANIRSVGR